MADADPVSAHLFKRGEIVGTVDQDEIATAVIDRIEHWDDDAAPGAAA